jgi:HPt (histidine-containing phosphotransfer) domain-containing protein
MNLVQITFDERLDTDFLNELFGDDKEHATMVFEQFLKEIRVQLKEMDNSFNSGNSELLRQKVHKLKPVFSFVGLTWLTGKAEIIETQCRENSDPETINELYKDFTKNILEFIPIIENEVVKLKE